MQIYIIFWTYLFFEFLSTFDPLLNVSMYVLFSLSKFCYLLLLNHNLNQNLITIPAIYSIQLQHYKHSKSYNKLCDVRSEIRGSVLSHLRILPVWDSDKASRWRCVPRVALALHHSSTNVRSDEEKWECLSVCRKECMFRKKPRLLADENVTFAIILWLTSIQYLDDFQYKQILTNQWEVGVRRKSR